MFIDIFGGNEKTLLPVAMSSEFNFECGKVAAFEW